MKNKTIEILSEGEHYIPEGTKFKNIGYSENWQTSKGKKVKIYDTNKNFGGHELQVDFSDLPPLYPTKGMEVPEEGIEFMNGKGLLLDAGENGVTFDDQRGPSYMCFVKWSDKHVNFKSSELELKRILPSTKTVCAECRKEVCECKYESGFYRINMGKYWTIRYYDRSNNAFFHSDGISESLKWAENDGQNHVVDWNNPINVTPEQEPTNEKL